MADRIFPVLTCILLVAAAGDATAMELDAVLPTDIPGYGVPNSIGVLDRPHPQYTPIDIDLGGVLIDPKLAADTGYDSRPNGTGRGSAVLGLDPSIAAVDPVLGFGAYLAGSATAYPAAPEQSLSGYTVALGEHAVLPQQTLTLAAAALAAQETGFGLDTIAITKPIGVTAQDIRGSDAIVFGMATLTPDVELTDFRFDNDDGQNRTDYRQSLTAEFTPGGPARFVAVLHATESVYRNPALTANSYSALAGIADTATGIWNIRLLGGAAARQPETGARLTAPVLEASIGWMPTQLDSLQLDAAREIDDPDQESANGYTLSELQLSAAHEYLRNVIITASFTFSHAAYFNTKLVESLYNANLAVAWHLNRSMAVDASYAFNDRQANFLNAANQHIFTLGVTWSP